MGAGEAEGVEHGDGVERQVGDRIRPVGEGPGRTAGVAMVVADHAMALGQAGDERVGPRDPGGVRAHDEEERRRVGIAGGVCPEPDTGGRVDVARRRAG